MGGELTSHLIDCFDLFYQHNQLNCFKSSSPIMFAQKFTSSKFCHTVDRGITIFIAAFKQRYINSFLT